MVFFWYDVLMFVGMLLLSGAVGVHFGCFETKQATTNEYLFGDRKMQIIPVAFSVAVSQFSAAFLVGIPADVYRYGATCWLMCLSMIIFVIINNYVFMPVFHKLELTSAYEYLERRFDEKVKLFFVFLFVLVMTFYLPLVAYVPSLAFSTATGINFHVTSIFVCGICVFYTTIGGLKAVVWTDLIQLIAVVISLLSIIIVNFRSEGYLNVLTKAKNGGRLDIFDFDPDPTKRESFWIIVVGYTTQMVAQVSIHQSGVQKFLSLPTLRKANWSAIYFALSYCIVVTLCIFIGLGMFAKYDDCDPVLNHTIKVYDQMVPLYLKEITQEVPGLSGLFLAALLSAALSTVSSNLNALAATIYNDFLKKYMKIDSEKKISMILKLIVLVNGIICICLVFLINYMREGIFALAIALSSIALGPLLGVFILGFFFPKANAQGGLYGIVGGFLFLACIVIPAKYYQQQGLIEYPQKMTSIDDCQINDSSIANGTNFSNNFKISNNTNYTPSPIFRISFYYFTLVGTLATVFIGLVVSYLTKNNNHCVDRNLISPVCHWLLPKQCKKIHDDVKYSNVETELQTFGSNN